MERKLEAKILVKVMTIEVIIIQKIISKSLIPYKNEIIGDEKKDNNKLKKQNCVKLISPEKKSWPLFFNLNFDTTVSDPKFANKEIENEIEK